MLTKVQILPYLFATPTYVPNSPTEGWTLLPPPKICH